MTNNDDWSLAELRRLRSRSEAQKALALVKEHGVPEGLIPDYAP